MAQSSSSRLAGLPRVTYGLVGLTCLVYVLQLGSTFLFGYANMPAQLDWLEVYGARINVFIHGGEIWRFLTPALLHASLPHLAFNMYALVVFGTGLERAYGHFRFAILYVLAAFAGNVLSFLLSVGYSVGASSAIFGLVGAQMIFVYQNRKQDLTLFGSQRSRSVGQLSFIVVVGILLAFNTPGIDVWAHIGGLVAGLIFAWFAGPVLRAQPTSPELYVELRDPRCTLTGASFVIVVFGALAVWGMLAPITR